MKWIPTLKSSLTAAESKPIKIYLGLVLFFALLFAVLTPPNQVPDENAHFLRAYEIANGQFIPNTRPNNVPAAFEEIQALKPLYTLRGQLNLLAKNSANEEVKESPTYSTYPILIYLPQALGIGLARLLHLSPGIILLFGRVFNALAYVGLLLLALRIMPGKHWLFLLLFCTPTALYEAGSYSPDAMTNALALLNISLLFSVSKSEFLFSRKQLLGLFFATWLLSQGKINIVPLAMLLLMVPWQRFGSIFKKVMFMACCLAALLVTVAVWNHVSPIPDWAYKAGSIPTSQLLYVVLYPFTYLRALIGTFASEWVFWLNTWFGGFGWLETLMPEPILLFYLLVLVFLAGVREEAFSLSPWKRWVAGLTGLVAVTITSILLYLVWTPYQAGHVEGVQGRYLVSFVPLFFLLIPAFLGAYPALKRFQGWVAIVSSGIVLAAAAAVIILRFYVVCGASYFGMTACFLPLDEWQGSPVPLAPIVKGMLVEQEIIPECDQLYRVKLYAQPFDRVNNSFLEVTILDKDTLEVVKQHTVDNRYLSENPAVFIPFDPVDESKGKIYIVRITSDASADTAVTLNRSEGDQYLPGQLWVNGVPQDGDLIFEYGCKIGFN